MSDYNVIVVNKSGLDLKVINPVINAINLQLREVKNVWHADGFVGVVEDGTPVPPEHYIVELVPKIDDPTLGGIHYFNERGNVFATVPVQGPNLNDGSGRRVPWSLALSHEVLEMIVDPYGDRTQEADAIVGEGKVSYLKEICDPCQHLMFAKEINGHLVSDFYTPEYFEKGAWNKGPFSAYKSITKPLEILPGGYICWRDAQGRWFRGDWSKNKKQVTERELFDFRLLPAGSLRERIDYFTHQMMASGADKKTTAAMEWRFRSRIAKKFKEAAQAHKHLEARSAERDNALTRHTSLHKQVKRKKLSISWSKPRQRTLR